MQASYIPYLVLNDYLTTIRSDQFNNQLLDAVEEGGDFERMEAESFAIDKIRSILGSYFYLDFELRPILPYSFTKKYYAGDRIILDFPLWIAGSESEVGGVQDGEDQTNQYNIGDCVLLPQSNPSSKYIAYCCKIPNSDTSFREANWIRIGYQYDIYFVDYPYPIFQLNPGVQIGISTPGLYQANSDSVCWLKRIYSCRQDSLPLNHQAREQFYSINNIPTPNIFPNQQDPKYTDGNMQWLDRGEFYLKGVLPFYPSSEGIDLNDGVDAWADQYRQSWTFGDNRSSNIKQIMVALSISVLSSRNSYIQKVRRELESWAYTELRKIRTGEITTLIPILQPEQIGDISWGGASKVINTF